MSFDFDVDSGLLNLTFSEAIRKDNVSLRFIVLANGQPSVLEQYLEKSTAIGLDGPIVTIRLSRDDLNDLKKTSDLASTKDNTFLAILDEALINTNGNAVKEILPANATAEDQYVADTTPPALESFDLCYGQQHIASLLRLTLRQDGRCWKPRRNQDYLETYSMALT